MEAMYLRSLKSHSWIFFCSVILASCSHAPGSSALPVGVSEASGASTERPNQHGYKRLFRFNGKNGQGPGALTAFNGLLYGTTGLGGPNNDGVLFTIAASGSERELNTFHETLKDNTGGGPNTPLIEVGGELYGTANGGGYYNNGTFFKVTSSGKISVIYNFKGYPDVAYPGSGLTYLDGVFYGTSTNGGTSNNGTVFAVTASGKEHLLHSFKGGVDGEDPQAALTAVNGILYGTTPTGGAPNGGTVFKITTSGKERVLHAFTGTRVGSHDGFNPHCSLIDLKGLLYGTTTAGGLYGGGTVFTITTSGKEHVLHPFEAPPQGTMDGNSPQVGLTEVNGVLYGTTSGGGGPAMVGSVYKVTTSGQETVLYGFQNGRDGANPFAALTYFKGKLYGTTSGGGGAGSGGVGEGTIFEIKP
jgi:uncharacterized repeat protein (TIGR03803 family)